jgi:hypothetical protein
MTASIRLPLKPWQVPNFANVDMPPRPRQDGMVSNPSFKVEELAQDALDDLAAQWLADLYTKANKTSPFTKPI